MLDRSTERVGEEFSDFSPRRFLICFLPLPGKYEVLVIFLLGLDLGKLEEMTIFAPV